MDKPTSNNNKYKILKLTDTSMELFSLNKYKDSDRKFYYSLTRVKE